MAKADTKKAETKAERWARIREQNKRTDAVCNRLEGRWWH